MAPRKKVVEEEQLKLPLDPADVPKEGELLVNMNVGTAVGRIITVNQTGIADIKEAFDSLPSTTLAMYASTIDGNAHIKAIIKQCSGLRSALTRAHKDAKAPFWDACKTLDAKLKELNEEVLKYETPLKEGLAAYDNNQAKAAADAQAARLAELEAENAKLRQHLEKQDVIPPFEDRKVSLLVRGREAAQAARALFGDSYDEVKTDERGVNYVLEVTLQRKEIQDV